MTKQKLKSIFFVGYALLAFPTGCDGDDDTNDGKTESDSNTSGDTDADSDTDTDTDTDSDSDADTGSEQLPLWPNDKYISIDEVYERVQANDPDMLLLNVSDEEFYNMGHIENSLKIPWDELEANLEKVDSKKHIVIYCRRGVRSESAYTALSQNGFTLLWVMEGGLEDWIERGYPTVP